MSEIVWNNLEFTVKSHEAAMTCLNKCLNGKNAFSPNYKAKNRAEMNSKVKKSAMQDS